MKKSAALLLALVMVLCLFTGCSVKKRAESSDKTETTSTTEQTTEPTTVEQVPVVDIEPYKEIYKPVIEECINVLSSGGEYNASVEGLTGLLEVTKDAGTTEEALNGKGYVIMDVSSDGVPELLVGDTDGNRIYSVFTCVDDTAKNVIDVESRSEFFLTSGNKFYKAGANDSGTDGSPSSYFGTLRLSNDGTVTLWEDFYFFETNIYTSAYSYYHNTTGSTDAASSEQLNITEDEFNNTIAGLKGTATQVSFTPFSKYGEDDCALTVKELTGPLTGYEDHAEFEADNTEYTTTLLFTVTKEVKNVEILSITVTGVDENSEAIYERTSVYQAGNLTAERPLVFIFNFVGDTANYGIQYTDDNGATRTFSINQSGMDGSIFLSEI